MDSLAEALTVIVVVLALLACAGEPDIADAIRDRIGHGACQ